MPAFASHAKLRYNEPRKQWVILAPERLLVPDETAVGVLRLIDGKSSIKTMIDAMTERYKAPRAAISRDILALLQQLSDKGFLSHAEES